ncbi:GGDEF domain-containing protein [Angustibacter peucedani]
MDEQGELATRLLERAQSGEEHEVLAEAERLLREPTGDLVDGAPALHYARAVALAVIGDDRACMAACDLMVAAADREGSPGWRSCALALRADERLRLGEQDIAEQDMEAVLRDLVDAEAGARAEASGLDARVASRAHTGVALGYHHLRLYELAVPQYEAAFELSLRSDDGTDAACMWLLNLTYLHLDWALELYRVGQPAEAEKHSREAESFASRARDAAGRPQSKRWRDMGGLLAACARADSPDPDAALADIEKYEARITAHGMEVEFSGAAPFHAVALSRCGQHAEALELIEQAIASLGPGAPWTAVAAAQHTRAHLLASGGSADAAAALEYGEALAQALWRQRLRSLHVATTMQSYDVLRAEHERVSESARTDPLTGIANRRAFDAAVEALREAADGSRPVAVLLVDLDHFKEINDTLGHDTGDDVLRRVAVALTTNLRDGDLVARLGGDEFAALLPGASVEAAHRVAQRMVKAVDAIDDCTATASIGISSGDARAVSSSVATADRAMYEAKRAGGNRVSRGTPTP